MKITSLTTVLAAVLGLAFISAPLTTHAQTSTSTTTPAASTAAPEKKKSKSPYTSYKGKISALDASSVTVTTKKGDLKLAIDAKTTFQADKKKAAASDFAVGDDVTGSYATGADGSLTAHSVHKKAAK